MPDDDLKFKREVVVLVSVLNIMLHKLEIDTDITCIAALKVLARIYENSADSPLNKKDIRSVTLGELEAESNRLGEIALQELEFILQDQI